MKIDKVSSVPNQITLSLSGTIDEDAIFPPVPAEQAIILELEKVDRINSCGIREWIGWMKKIPSDRAMQLENCPKSIVDQINNVDGFIPPQAKVTSFFAPYYCESCGHLSPTKIMSFNIAKNGKNAVPTHVECQKCKKLAERDFAMAKYLKFLGVEL